MVRNYTGLRWYPLDWLWGFATHPPTSGLLWRIVAEKNHTFCWQISQQFRDWHWNFLEARWISSPQSHPLSLPASSLFLARWISLDLNADHYPTATGLQWGERRLLNSMTAMICSADQPPVLPVAGPTKSKWKNWCSEKDLYRKGCLSTRHFFDRR